jgi:anti-sigma B factor antagonist
MRATEFTAETRREGDVAVLDLSGDVSATAEGRLQAAYDRLLAEPVVVLDFSSVDYVNSTGIALIVGLLAEARKTGQEIRARGLAEHYREIFRITRLSDFMTILDDEGDER